jgi:hypothetical protein
MLWNFGIRYHKRDHGIVDNPFSKMGLTKPPPGSTRWTMEHVDKFVATADDNNAESVGTAALICYLFNQRVTDALTMPKTAWDGEALQIRQSKTRTLVWVPAMKEFRDLMAKVAVPEDVTTLIADERTGIPYTEFAISDRVAIIRDLAGLPKHLQLHDLERTRRKRARQAPPFMSCRRRTGTAWRRFKSTPSQRIRRRRQPCASGSDTERSLGRPRGRIPHNPSLVQATQW